MDQHIGWLRREIVIYLCKRLSVEFGLCAALVGGYGIFAGWNPALVFTTATVAGQLFVATRLGLGLMSNPLSYSAIARHIDSPSGLIPVAVDHKALDERAAMFGSLGFDPVLNMAGPGQEEGESLYCLLIDYDRQTTVVLGSVGDTTVLVSKLSDGRLLATTDLVIPPHLGLVVNQVTAGSATMTQRHRRVLEGLGSSGLRPVASASNLCVELLQLELESYQELGPFLGSFLNLTPKRRSWRLGLRLSSGALIRRSGRSEVRLDAAAPVAATEDSLISF